MGSRLYDSSHCRCSQFVQLYQQLLSLAVIQQTDRKM